MTLPAPLVPAHVDLRGVDWMPFWGVKVRKSESWRLATLEARSVMVDLWFEAFANCPAGSLPNDHKVLATTAGIMDPRIWKRVAQHALRGFVLCSDGRLYHPLIAELALTAWTGRNKARQRQADHRARRDAAVEAVPTPNGVDLESDPSPIRSETAADPSPIREPEPIENNDLGPPVTRDVTGQSRAEQSRADSIPLPPTTTPSSATITPLRGVVADFDEWWAEYPRKVGKDAARRAYAKVRGRKDGPSAAALILAVRAQAEGWDDPQYVPHPTTWLNQGRWNDDPRASSRRIVPLTRRTETMDDYVARLQREHGGGQDQDPFPLLEDVA